MRKVLLALGLIILIGLGFIGYQFYRNFLRIETVRIDDRFYVFLGGGGNAAVLVADDGALVVDTKFWWPGRRLLAKIREITGQPVTMIINTHYHFDHTHGNPNYAPGTTVLAHRHTREHLEALDEEFWQEAPAQDLLPNDFVEGQREFAFGDETVRVFYFGRGHTDGDVVVYFVTRKILHAGDLFFNGMYPSIDLGGGGSAAQWPDTLEQVLRLEVSQIIPGHGPLGEEGELRRFQSYLRSLSSQVEKLVKEGKTLVQVKEAVDLTEYDDFRSIPFFTSREKNVEWAYQEAVGKGP